MKRSFPALTAAIFAASSLFLSCSGSGHGSSSDTDSIAADTTLHELEIDLTVMSAVRSYAIDIDTNSYHLCLSADLQWPKKIGDYDIKPLQDSIVAYSFPNVTRESVKNAILAYVSDVTSTGLNDGGARITPIDRIYPDSINSFTVSLDARVLEFGKRLIAYQIAEYSYLGGAHPVTMSRTFTYDLQKKRVVGLNELIAPDKINDFTVAVMKQLAAQLDITPTELRESLLSPSFTVSDDVYCADGYIFVHYNPYQILPYSFGTIDVQMSPYEYQSLLTPYAREILLD